jgi:pyrroline-5-carboxylate reductase
MTVEAEKLWQDKRLGFIGAGNMAEAICRGVLHAGLLNAPAVAAADPDEARRDRFTEMGVATLSDNAELVARSDVVVLAVKPQMMLDVLAEVGGKIGPQHLVISIAAGISLGRIEENVSTGSRVVRTMPNTPLLVGEGAVALCAGSHTGSDDLALARALFEAAAPVVTVVDDEGLLDTITALSGSGPAYVFYLVEQMVAAATAEGLNADEAHRLAVQTIVGAGALMRETGEAPAALRAKVTSPGGTTAAALTHLQSHDAGTLWQQAVRAASQRARELAG